MAFQIERNTGVWQSVEYSSFSVGPEADKYRLSVTGFSGDTGDAMAAPINPMRVVNGMQFSSSDQDNDNSGGQCLDGVSGWWFNNCARSTLNRDTNADWNAETDVAIKDVTFVRMLVKLD